tara:strand:- start:117 stop:1343 length:1227 start_codon:yes stop_codon:yes gene_type:complete
MKNKVNLYFFYLSRNLLWSIFLIIKEERIFPNLIYINDLSRKNLEFSGNNFYKNLIKKLCLIMFIKQISLKGNLNSFDTNDPFVLRKIIDISENNISYHFKSLFISSIKKISDREINNLFSCYSKGYKIGQENKNVINYVFNGRKKEIFLFFEGLKVNSKIKRIEITFKNNKRHIYSTSGYIWKAENVIDVENKYGFNKDLSFYQKRIKGLDHDGKKFFRARKNKNKYTKIDVAVLLSTPYEFIGFTHSSREFMNIIKNSFREIIKIKNLGYKCIIRNHPNFEESHFLDKKLFSKWFEILRKNGIIVSDYNDEISSYDIAQNSKIIITLGSTIGGELSFIGKRVYDFNEKSVPVYFNVVKPYDFEEVILNLNKICNKKPKFKNGDFERFSGYNLGWGIEIPSILQIGL